MDYGRLEVKVGLTVFVAILLLIVGLMWLEDFSIKGETYDVHAVFPMVGGVNPGDAVNVNGVDRGEVKSVSLRDRDVIVTMQIDRRVEIPVDSRVVLQTKGIMGMRIVTILIGDSDRVLDHGSMIKGVYDPGISEALASMGKVMEDLRGLTADIRKIAEVVSEGEELKEMLKDLSGATEELRRLVEDAAPEVREGVSAFSSSSRRFDSLLARNEESIDSLFATMDAMSKTVPGVTEDIAAVSESLRKIVERLESDESTLGALMQDRALLDSLQETITGLDELVTDIKANPRKYLKVEIF